MSHFLYTLLYYCLTPLLFLRLLIKHQKSRQYKEQRQDLRLAERLAFFDNKEFTNQGQANPIWFHTVSVGEFIATLPLLKQVMLEYPQFPLLITCTTTTGSSQIIKTFSTEIKQGKIFHVYLPYDLPGSMRRFLEKTQPHLAIIMETEIWPNLLHITQQMNIPIWLLNARMSARSAEGYKRFNGMIKTTLQEFTGIAAQDKLDAERLIQLGAKAESLTITGSIKFDIQLDLKELEAGHELRQQLNWQDKKVLIAASTHQGEDEILLNVFQNLRQYYPQLVMLIVPRHPERFQSVYQLLTASDYTIAKRSELPQFTTLFTKKLSCAPFRKGGSAIDILIGDSMGEMMRYFSCADMVFMGGTMVPTGGHNILEPAAMGLPIVYGPHMFNFNAINELFIHYQAALQVMDEADLEKSLNLLLSDERRADEMAAKAKQLIAKNAGAKDKMLALLRPYLS